MKSKWIWVALIGAALGLPACSSSQAAKKCTGKYVPINSAEHYPQER